MQRRILASAWAVTLLGCLLLPAKPSAQAVSIEPCPPSADSNAASGCETIAQMIGRAFGSLGDQHAPDFLESGVVKKWVRGGPRWIYAERYTVLNNSGAPVPDATPGPMLRTLLESRLRLSVHQDPRRVGVAALEIAKGGFRLSPSDPASCLAPDADAPNRKSAPAPGQAPQCGFKFGVDGPNATLKATGATLDQIARALNAVVDRLVVDQTGIRGQFTFKIEFDQGDGLVRTPLMNNNQAPPGPSYDDPSVFYMPPGFALRDVLVRQLGLRLAPLPGPQVVVVDHVERPSGPQS